MTRLEPNVAREIQNCVHNCGGDRRKCEPICEHKFQGQEKGKVLKILCLIQTEIVIENCGKIIRSARIVINLSGRQRHVLSVPCLDGFYSNMRYR
jgi:hypothetical protein